MSEFRIDVGHLRMIAEYYDRKCPCWGGRHSCPCLPFVETRSCKCGSVRPANDPKAQDQRFVTYRIDFDRLGRVVGNDRKCPEDDSTLCFCKEFLKLGKCRAKVFRQDRDF